MASVVFLSAALLFGAPPADGTTNPSGEAPKKEEKTPPVLKENIVVTATRSAESGDVLPLSVTVISEEQVQESPALRTEDVLRTLPGVELPATNSAGHYITTNTVSVRGLGENRALVLVDGVPLNDAYRGYVHWDQVPIDTIQRVELVRGGNASLFGNLALGGTINLLTRPVTNDRIDLRALYGSRDTRQFNLGLDRMVGSKVGIGFNINRMKTDGYIRTVPEERRPLDVASPGDNLFYQGRVDFSPSDRFNGSVRASHFKFDLGLGTPLWVSNNKSTDVAGNTHYAFGGTSDLATSFFYRDQSEFANFTRVSPDGTSEVVTSLYDTPVTDMGASVSWISSAGPSVPLFGFGLDVRHSEMDDRKTNVDLSGQPTGVTLSAGSQDSFGIFGQVSWNPAADFELLVSGRLDRWKNYDGREGAVGGNISEYDTETSTEFNPRISARYRFTDGLAVRGAAYRAFHAPLLADLYRSNFRRASNPSLGPETMIGGEVGLDLAGARWRGEANLFWNRIENTISDLPISSTPFVTVQPTNLGETRSQGLELIGRYEMNQNWSVQGNYSYTDSTITRNDEVPALEGNMLARVPRNSGSVSVRYDTNGGAWAVGRLRGQSHTWAEIDNHNEIDSFVLLDLSGSLPLSSRLDLVVIGENLFDRHYVGDYSIFSRLGQPRTITAGIHFRTRP